MDGLDSQDLAALHQGMTALAVGLRARLGTGPASDTA